MKNELYMPYIVDDIYSTARDGRPCAHKPCAEQFTKAGKSVFLEGLTILISMDILDNLQKRKQCIQFVVPMTDGYTMFTEAIRTSTTNATTVACILLEQ